jgi:hypothetical protein
VKILETLSLPRFVGLFSGGWDGVGQHTSNFGVTEFWSELLEPSEINDMRACSSGGQEGHTVTGIPLLITESNNDTIKIFLELNSEWLPVSSLTTHQCTNVCK